MPRFAILRHQPGPRSTRPLHWDLLFEVGDVLRTFACLNEPTGRRSLHVELLDDHRLEYLDYEGPVSCGRGNVTRWDCGEFEVIEESAEHWLVDVRGRRWNGRVRFTADGDHRWTVTVGELESD